MPRIGIPRLLCARPQCCNTSALKCKSSTSTALEMRTPAPLVQLLTTEVYTDSGQNHFSLVFQAVFHRMKKSLWQRLKPAQWHWSENDHPPMDQIWSESKCNHQKQWHGSTEHYDPGIREETALRKKSLLTKSCTQAVAEVISPKVLTTTSKNGQKQLLVPPKVGAFDWEVSHKRIE